jgi:hypothetical protein
MKEQTYDYVIEPQTRGNSRIRHSRSRVLGIAFRAPDVIGES